MRVIAILFILIIQFVFIESDQPADYKFRAEDADENARRHHDSGHHSKGAVVEHGEDLRELTAQKHQRPADRKQRKGR